MKTSWLYRLPFPNELNINFLHKDDYSYFSEALTHNTTPREGGRNGLTVSLPDEAKKIKEGRTINLKTSQGRKRVFIPKGWMFCTVSPFKCYSTNSRKKSKETFSLAALGNFIFLYLSLKGLRHAICACCLFTKVKLSSSQSNSKNNGPVLLFKTIFKAGFH